MPFMDKFSLLYVPRVENVIDVHVTENKLFLLYILLK